jgi:hypothetical protein
MHEFDATSMTTIEETSTGDLIAIWVTRVNAHWQRSRQPGAASIMGELAASYLVRDELGVRLRRDAGPDSECSKRAAEVLKSADDLLMQFTVEARFVDDLDAFDHYPRQSEWWWRRMPKRETIADL